MTNEERLLEIDNQLAELKKCYHGMDLPDHRKMVNTLDNLRWVDKNMGVRNSNHPRFKEAKDIISRLINDLKYT